jgi:hypothetical protein
MNILLIKLILMPLVIGGVTLASKKWGHQIGGIIASMPWIAGPILLFFIIEQGTDFAINSIKGVLIGVIGVLFFAYTYIFACQRFKWYWSLVFSYMSFLSVSLSLKYLEPFLSLNACLAINIVLSLIAIAKFPKLKIENSHSKILKNEIYLRMIVITIFVVLITFLAKILGPTWSGILTPFPIMTAILAAFTHYTQGAYGTSIVLKGMLTGFIGFALFLYLQAILLPIFSIPISFAIGFLVNIVMNISMRYLIKRKGI